MRRKSFAYLCASTIRSTIARPTSFLTSGSFFGSAVVTKNWFFEILIGDEFGFLQSMRSLKQMLLQCKYSAWNSLLNWRRLPLLRPRTKKIDWVFAFYTNYRLFVLSCLSLRYSTRPRIQASCNLALIKLWFWRSAWIGDYWKKKLTCTSQLYSWSLNQSLLYVYGSL